MTEHAALARPIATSLHGYRVKWPQKCLSARIKEQSVFFSPNLFFFPSHFFLPAAGFSCASDSLRPTRFAVAALPERAERGLCKKKKKKVLAAITHRSRRRRGSSKDLRALKRWRPFRPLSILTIIHVETKRR